MTPEWNVCVLALGKLKKSVCLKRVDLANLQMLRKKMDKCSFYSTHLQNNLVDAFLIILQFLRALSVDFFALWGTANEMRNLIFDREKRESEKKILISGSKRRRRHNFLPTDFFLVFFFSLLGSVFKGKRLREKEIKGMQGCCWCITKCLPRLFLCR